jgi:hypothetical protein
VLKKKLLSNNASSPVRTDVKIFEKCCIVKDKPNDLMAIVTLIKEFRGSKDKLEIFL